MENKFSEGLKKVEFDAKIWILYVILKYAFEYNEH